MLTRKQRQFYETLRSFTARKGYFPSVRELGKLLGLSSPATVHNYLNRLLERGYLAHRNNRWEIVTPARQIPLMGIVPAGIPIEVFENLGDEVELPEWMVDGTGDIVAFRVQGDSMIDALIQENDVVVIKRVATAESGEMVVALLHDGSITLKRLKRDSKKIWLEPENQIYPPIHDQFQLVGKVIGVLRKYR